MNIPNYLGMSDMVGLVVAHDELTGPEPDDDEFDRIKRQLHETISQAAESAGDHDLAGQDDAPSCSSL